MQTPGNRQKEPAVAGSSKVMLILLLLRANHETVSLFSKIISRTRTDRLRESGNERYLLLSSV